jgi:hypothetical protein
MATYCVEMPDQDFLRVINAIAANYGRTETISNPAYVGETIDNPNFNPELPEDENNPRRIASTEPEIIENTETKAQFTNRIVRSFLAENVTAYEKRLALQQAEQNLDTSITIIDPQT